MPLDVINYMWGFHGLVLVDGAVVFYSALASFQGCQFTFKLWRQVYAQL